ncbi:MAG: hypothetical protein WCK26_00005 [Candidatus Saccharibacteria bacterium]
MIELQNMDNNCKNIEDDDDFLRRLYSEAYGASQDGDEYVDYATAIAKEKHREREEKRQRQMAQKALSGEKLTKIELKKILEYPDGRIIIGGFNISFYKDTHGSDPSQTEWHLHLGGRSRKQNFNVLLSVNTNDDGVEEVYLEPHGDNKIAGESKIKDIFDSCDQWLLIRDFARYTVEQSPINEKNRRRHGEGATLIDNGPDKKFDFYNGMAS